YRRHEQRRAAEPGYRNPMKPFPPVRLAEHQALTEEDWAWLAALPLKLQLSERFHVIHAGCEPGRRLTDQRPATLLRCRRVARAGGRMLSLDADPAIDSVYWAEIWPGPESLLFGHQVFPDGPRHFAPAPGVVCVGLDTGCCFGYQLSAVRLAGDELVATFS